MASSSQVLRCDICLQKDGFKKLRLLQCRDCGVTVHGECYGLTTFPDDFLCWACQAVGKSIQGSTVKGKVKTIVQEKRPTECALCAVNSGAPHAMHALYRDYGPTGKQLRQGDRLVWVHTLCALTVCTHRGTQGSVYGCDENGDYEAEDEGVDHFVMCGLNGEAEKDGEWVKMLKEHRELVCTICGDRDKSPGKNLRVPLQCCAGDADEFPEFRKYHRKLGEPCMQAMHVGCAMWGTRGNPPQVRRMWFYPGLEEGAYTEPVCEIFCDLHARQMNAGPYGLTETASAPPSETSSGILCYEKDKEKQPAPADVLPTYTGPSVERRASYTDVAKEKERPPKQAIPKKRSSKVLSETKATSSFRYSDLAKTAPKPSQSRAPPAGASNKAASTVSAHTAPQRSTSVTASIPRKNRADAGGKTTSAPTVPRKAPAPLPTIPRKAPAQARGQGAVSQVQSVERIEPPPNQTKDNAASQSLKTLTPSVPTQQLKPPQKQTTQSGAICGSAEVSKSSSLPFTMPPKPLRRKTRSISEEKTSETSDTNDDAMSIDSDDGMDRRNIESDPDGLWMNDAVQGVVETEELPPIAEPPEGGSNPWTYLWTQDATPFKLEIVSRTEKRKENFVERLES